MKKQALFLMAGALVAFASCNTATNNEGASQAQIDSMVNARVEEIRLEMMSQNDSLINAMALVKADSIIAAMKSGGKKAPAKTTTTKGKTNQPSLGNPSAEPTNTGGGLKSKSDQSKINDKNSVQGGGLKSQSDQNRTANPNKVQSGGLKSQSDQNKK